MTPQLALRVAVVGSFALAMFAIIFFRLWFLQVLSGDQYLQAATVNRVRNIAVPAPRGEIVDRSGGILVDSDEALAVQISPPDLPQSRRGAQRGVFRPPGAVCWTCRPSGSSARCPASGTIAASPTIPCDVDKQLALLPYANVTVKTKVNATSSTTWPSARTQFPGVEVQQVYLRNYPLHGLAAQLFGTVGPINPTEVKQKAYRGISPNAIIGQSGLEAA